MTRLALYLRTRWLLVLVVLVFVCFKIPHLYYGFYIDEGWVYAPALKAMAVHGPSLMPDAISPDLSRGHPLMFHFLCSLWIKLFGPSNVAIHAFMLLLSVIFLIALFEGCRQLFGNKAASLALLLVATRVIFFVQSSMAYPEIMMALFTFLALFYYSKDKFVLTSLMLFILFHQRRRTDHRRRDRCARGYIPISEHGHHTQKIAEGCCRTGACCADRRVLRAAKGKTWVVHAART